LLLLVSGLAAIILPRAAIAHANENRQLLLRYYIRGTIFSIAVLLAGSAIVWLASPWIFLLWFKNAMPATQAILPLMLIHTIAGGSSAVGRSILLGMGKVKPFTAAVLIAGVTNVLLSWVFVTKFGLGLRGIVLGTICAVVGRCAIWMPWYVLRSLTSSQSSPRPTNVQTPP
jgi:MATE family multidrug resistance protein